MVSGPPCISVSELMLEVDVGGLASLVSPNGGFPRIVRFLRVRRAALISAPIPGLRDVVEERHQVQEALRDIP